ncbi:MAG: hypothetical protein NW224_15700 [Leptolyngbyaceae cyanobacterium bins.302]|nr:hypothetical protein [Leptolyngbyaceae cyanobacterium bins.302]
MTQPNYKEMSRPELKAYILEHRDDIEAMRAYFHDPNVKWNRMPPMFDENGQPIEENIRLAEETIRRLAEEDRKKQQDKQQ